MTNITKTVKRMAIYVIYDRDGILDPYRETFLKSLSPHVDYIVATVSGGLLETEIEKLSHISNHIFVRENKGLLAKAWADSIAHIGWDQIYEYDELLLLNDSFFGPIYPLNDFFIKLENSDSDLYGVMKNYEDKNITTIGGRDVPGGHFLGSLCYFYVVKNRLLHSAFFKEYWSSCPGIMSDWDTVFFAEIEFYERVLSNGFKIDSYQSDSLKGYFFDNLSHSMCDLVSNEKIPFVRIRPLGTDEKEILSFSDGSDPRNTLEFIKEYTNYDINLIWNYLIRTKNMVDLYYQLQLQFILGDYKRTIKGLNIALLITVESKNNIEKMNAIIKNFPPKTTIYLSSHSKKVLDIFKKINNGLYKIEYRLMEDSITFDSSLWYTFSDVFLNKNFDYICRLRDVNSNYSGYKIHDDTMAKRCYDNLAGSKSVVNQIVNIFDTNPHIGMIMAPMDYHGDYFSSNQRGWQINYGHIEYLLNLFEISCPHSIKKIPFGPPGGMFWMKREILENAVLKNIELQSFCQLKEGQDVCPTPMDFVYGLIAQSKGYCFATVHNQKYVRNDLNNITYALNKIYENITNSTEGIYSLQNTIKATDLFSNSQNKRLRIISPELDCALSVIDKKLPKKITKLILTVFNKIIK